MTPEQKAAFGAKMKAAREAKKVQSPSVSPTTSENQGSASTETAPLNVPQPTSNDQDTEFRKKMDELDAALRRTNELNDQLEKKNNEVTPTFNAGQPVSPAEKQNIGQIHKNKAQIMKEKLALQPKIRIFMPLEGREKPGTLFPVTINGHRMYVPKGMYVDVPEQVADIIKDSLQQTEAAIHNDKEITGNAKKEEMLL